MGGEHTAGDGHGLFDLHHEIGLTGHHTVVWQVVVVLRGVGQEEQNGTGMGALLGRPVRPWAY